MRKLFLIALVVMLSCETEPTNSRLSTEKIRLQLLNKTPLELRDAFNALTPEEQRNVWRDRLVSESKFYTGEKAEYLQLIAKLQRVSPNFDPQNAKTKCIELFGVSEAKRILTTFHLPNESYSNSRLLVPWGRALHMLTVKRLV